jgi:hypothetical protein
MIERNHDNKLVNNIIKNIFKFFNNKILDRNEIGKIVYSLLFNSH